MASVKTSMPQVKNIEFIDIIPERDPTSLSFPKGNIHFYWNLAGNKVYIPSMSYFTMRLKLTKNGDDVITRKDGLVPSMFLAHNLFQQVSVKLGGVEVSTLNDYVPEVAALKNRIGVSETRRAFRGHALNLEQACALERGEAVFRDGVEYGKVCGFYDLEQLVTDPDNNILYSIDQGTPDLVIEGLTAEQVLNLGRILGNDPITIETDDAENNDFLNCNIASFQPGGDGISFEITLSENWVYDAIDSAPIDDKVKIATKTRPTRRSEDLEVIFNPPLGFFEIGEWITGETQTTFYPQSSDKYQTFAFESLLPINSAVQNTDYAIEIVDFKLRLCTGDLSKPLSGSFDFVLNECSLQKRALTTSALSTKTFNVRPNSHMLTLAVQASDAGFDQRTPKTKFKTILNTELDVRTFYVKYKGVQKPQPNPDLRQVTGLDYFKRSYYENLVQSGAIVKDNHETYEDFIERGPFFCLRFPEDNLSEVANVSISFESPFVAEDRRGVELLLFDHFTNSFSMKVNKGVLVEVKAVSNY